MSTINVKEAAMKQAEENGGKLAVVSKVTIDSKEDLSIAYTQGRSCFIGDCGKRRTRLHT